MEPVIPTGTLLFVSPVSPEILKPYDVITFRIGEDMTATHRIVSVHEDKDGLWFRTKGDANTSVDGKLVHERNVIGAPVASVPGGGYLICFLQKNIVSVLFVFFGAAGMVLVVIPALVSENKADTKQGKYLNR